MSKLDSRNIYIECDGSIYKFMNCKIEPNDGSFYVTLLRDGKNTETVTYSSKESSLQKIKHERPRKKLVRISYHSSGCVLYRYTELRSNYFEPITRITNLNIFATWSIPGIRELDKAESTQDEDLIISFPQNDQRVEFILILAPWDKVIDETHFAVRYEGLFTLLVIVSAPGRPIPLELKEHFITFAPNEGIFGKQAIGNDQALIEYHHKINNTRDLIIYAPNNAGIYTIITAVPMRIAPNVKIDFVDNQFSTELVSCKNNVIKFKVKNIHGHTIKKEVAIKSIELDSEL
jgi:hypothetical protein